MGNRARIYCDQCSAFDITERAFKKIIEASDAYRKRLSQKAKTAPEGKLLVVLVNQNEVNENYELRESKTDRPAPQWLTPSQ
jgi:hypothetical protein